MPPYWLSTWLVVGVAPEECQGVGLVGEDLERDYQPIDGLRKRTEPG